MTELVCSWETPSGLPAAILRFNWHLNGYVGVPPGHALWGATSGCWFDFPIDEGDVRGLKHGPLSLLLAAANPKSLLAHVRVHGGITYNDTEMPHVGEDYPGYWWFGFDCGHVDDNPAECNSDYVSAECEYMAAKLTEIAAYLCVGDHS